MMIMPSSRAFLRWKLGSLRMSGYHCYLNLMSRKKRMLITFLDWNIYFGEPIPTVEAQQESPIINENDAEIIEIFDTRTSNSRGKKPRQMSLSDWTPTSSHEEVLQTLQPSITYPQADNLWPESSSEQTYMPTPSFFGLSGATPSTPKTSLSAISPSPNLAARVMVGTIYSCPDTDTYTFQCRSSTCHDRTFSRWPDFTRHYNGAHATTPTVYWCDVEGCPRGKAARNRPFPRKDKLNDHAKSIHGVRN
ncbi:hypothetical protein HBI81_242760 [Parastagonospora nodorum]|nr:hypothetical protein HBI95_247380 [Parastagonospora nodorum]KAH5014078.1 hypothetical protein HBI74_183380 [Parastagonospora nodorum]KAH5016474.1 hypothetical protein HBI75_183050 [Parastagonospora nodorum]KAH5056567.1 hypothetical protein HBI73_219940 [Parastagonospora nodorum]KAH5113555.1 hypothetical protein HBH71_156470 [Parastagonospora nodorum]